jgi:eukaryotic-like serine/threonine-protein kinase
MSTFQGPAQWARLAPYVDQAFEMEPPQRATWLATLRVREPQTATELEAFFDGQAALEKSTFLADAPLEQMHGEVMTTHRIGGYVLERLLGRGGMGEVWLGVRSDGRFEGRCAVKFLDVPLSCRNLTERFSREGRLLGRLEHPGIARLLDAGETTDGRPYLVLEYVDGVPIDQYCAAHELGALERVQLFAQVVSALAYAHQNLIVHRDLKPANVLVASGGVVKVLDFGIAKLISAEPDYDAAQTRAEDALLTPQYAAPEQFLGATPSTSTDVYQLGMLLFTMLTDQPPFSAELTRAERIEAALAGVAPQPSAVCAAQRRKDLRGDLDAIVARAMRREPAERYVTAAALGEDLLRFLNLEPVHARRGDALYRFRRFFARHRAATSVAAVAALALCATAAVAVHHARESARQRDDARRSAQRADSNASFLAEMLSRLSGESGPVSRERIMEDGLTVLHARYGHNPMLAEDQPAQIPRHELHSHAHQGEYDALLTAEALTHGSRRSVGF